ncbi:MAG: DUF1330 domain-containing protein [Roseovarius sp.]
MSRAAARGCYDSPAYRAILPLRAGNSKGVVVLIGGVGEGHATMDFQC